jgi:hypothetical protein
MTTPTRMLRWRPIMPPDRGADKAFVVGETGVEELDGLIRLERHGRVYDVTQGGWSILARQERNESFSDGWYWVPLMLGEETLTAIASEADVKSIVGEHYEVLEQQAQEWLAGALGEPVAGQDAAESERDRQHEEALGLTPSGPDMLGAVTAATPEPLEPRDAGVSENVQAALVERYVESAKAVAARLRATAADVERHVVPRTSLRDLHPDFTASAAEIVSDVQAMMGSLNLNRMVRAARDADLALRGRMP